MATRLRLTGGAPDEPDTGDYDALCATPGPRQVFAALFEATVGGMPAQSPEQFSEDATHRIHVFWLGDQRCGVKVTEIESAETTALPMRCTWETFGLPGVTLTWRYSLERAGQLGYCAFRHDELTCEFATAADQQRFAALWQQVLGKTPAFAPG
jgi:hypothetical protein